MAGTQHFALQLYNFTQMFVEASKCTNDINLMFVNRSICT